jgi:hypothetical protein
MPFQRHKNLKNQGQPDAPTKKCPASQAKINFPISGKRVFFLLLANTLLSVVYLFI